MFNTVYERPRKSVRVRLTMSGQAPLEGFLTILKDDTVGKALNGADHFLVFETLSQEKRHLAKAAIESVVEIEDASEATRDVLDPTKNSRLFRRFASDDPRVILGVEEGASLEEIRAAYHALARDFHPDRLAALGLHREIAAYADEVLKRINIAHDLLERRVAKAA
jgi:DnaJ-domain-containing protein 1